MPEAKYNIAIIGKTGTGKSTLLNYLFQVSIARAGVGRPVTEKGFHPYSFRVNDLPVCVFDSWGLEADKAQEWLLELEAELRKRGLDKAAPHWFHTILYCVNAGGHRVEAHDLKILRKFLTTKYKVTVILTKADLATAEQLAEMAAAIRQAHTSIPVIPVSAEEKELKSGARVRTWGRQDVFKQISMDLWDSICLRLPERCISVLKQTIESWRYEQLAVLETAPKNQLETARRQVGTALEDFENRIANGLFEQLIRTELTSTFSLYGRFRQVMLDFPEGRQVSVPKSLPDHGPSLLEKFPLLAGPIIGPLAYLTVKAIGERKKHSAFIEAVNTYCHRLKEEAEKLEPAISALLEELEHQFIAD